MWAVAVGYLAQLPRRKVVLGGASKINVMVGPRPTVSIFSHTASGGFGCSPSISQYWAKLISKISNSRSSMFSTMLCSKSQGAPIPTRSP
jgi:hypothetical protein